MNVAHTLHFLRNYVREPRTVGALAPSSRWLAAALAEPFRARATSARLLEVGAGTGPITRYLGELLGPDDCLDVCEVNPDFAKIIQRDVLSRDPLASGVRRGAVRLWTCRVQDIDPEQRFDLIIASLPFTVFPLAEVRAIFELVRRLLVPGGVFSYFEYAILRRISRTWSLGPSRTRIRAVSDFLDDQVQQYQLAARLVLRNLPPARVRHLRFAQPGASANAEVPPRRTEA